MTITNERWRYDMRVAIITANTDIYKGTKANESGEAVKLVAEEAGLEVVFMRALPLDREVLSTVMKRMTDGKTADLILTTGGAGCNPGDCTPEATMNIVDRPVPGIPEAMRAAYYETDKTQYAEQKCGRNQWRYTDRKPSGKSTGSKRKSQILTSGTCACCKGYQGRGIKNEDHVPGSQRFCCRIQKICIDLRLV